MKYLKVWTSFRDIIKPLSEAEKGRLFEMMLNYAESGLEPPEFAGNERFIWPSAKQSIDLTAERNEKLRENGSKGGQAKSRNKQELAKVSKTYQSVANVSCKEKKSNVKEYKEKESLLSDEEADGYQKEHDMVLTAAEDAGFKISNNVRSALIALYAEHGLDKVLNGLRSCSEHSAPNLAYLRACMAEKPRSGHVKVLPATNYEQRDYTSVQREIEDRQRKRVEEYLKSKGEVG